MGGSFEPFTMQTILSIEVFRTNVCQEYQARIILACLSQLYPSSRINFDLDDCDHILRIEGGTFCTDMIRAFLHERGFACDVLE